MNTTLYKAVDALEACKTPEEVAELLRRHECKGLPCIASNCPVAEYLHKVGCDPSAKVSISVASVDDGGRLVLTHPVRQFIRRFDDGQFGDLALPSAAD